MNQREKLIELLQSFESEYPKSFDSLYYELAAEADHLIANGVVVLPCRCCECDYHDHDGAAGYCNYWRRWSNMSDYCNHAKRKGCDE